MNVITEKDIDTEVLKIENKKLTTIEFTPSMQQITVAGSEFKNYVDDFSCLGNGLDKVNFDDVDLNIYKMSKNNTIVKFDLTAKFTKTKISDFFDEATFIKLKIIDLLKNVYDINMFSPFFDIDTSLIRLHNYDDGQDFSAELGYMSFYDNTHYSMPNMIYARLYEHMLSSNSSTSSKYADTCKFRIQVNLVKKD